MITREYTSSRTHVSRHACKIRRMSVIQVHLNVKPTEICANLCLTDVLICLNPAEPLISIQTTLNHPYANATGFLYFPAESTHRRIERINRLTLKKLSNRQRNSACVYEEKVPIMHRCGSEEKKNAANSFFFGFQPLNNGGLSLRLKNIPSIAVKFHRQIKIPLGRGEGFSDAGAPACRWSRRPKLFARCRCIKGRIVGNESAVRRMQMIILVLRSFYVMF